MATGREHAVLGSIRALFDEGTAAGLDDAQLLGRFVAGPEQAAGVAFEALVARHGPMVLGVCRQALPDPHDAQDAFQATFLVLARKARSIRKPGSLPSWLYGVARKVANRARADAARRRAVEAGATLPDRAAPGRDPEDLSALYEEIDRLPGHYRDPIVLCYLDGLTYEAAAQQLRWPSGTLSVRLKRAKDRLRDRLTRRGVIVPAGLLAAGLGSDAARASVAEGVIRMASQITAIGRATAAGSVPAPVVALAEGTMKMMRYKTIGFGAMGLGLVVLASTAALAVKATQEPTKAARSAPRPEPPRSWVRTFADGGTVELLGFSPHPSGPASWRTPEGEALPDAPYARSASNVFVDGSYRAWEFAVRLGNLRDKGASHRWKAVGPDGGGYSTSYGTARDADNHPVPGLEMLAIGLPAGHRSCSLQFGVAIGPWTTEIANGPDAAAHGRAKLSAIFGEAREEQGKTFVTVSHNVSDDDLRVVAVDLEGEEHTPIRSTGGSVSNFVQRELQFDLMLARLKEFRLQSRPFEWADFGAIPLPPQGK